jgi:methylmalonyl-CoA mutase N-terminal domain/subunit
MNPREEWQAAFEASKLRDAPYTTMSGIPLEPSTDPTTGSSPGVPLHQGPVRVDVPLEAVDDADVRRLRHGRGHNWRFKEIIKAGGDGLSTAFDMPTLLGIDSDDRWRSARSAAAAWRSTASPTWRTSTPAST